MNIGARTLRLFALVFAALAAGCGGTSGTNASLPNPPDFARLRHASESSPITHVIIIVQENRSVDDLFNGLPGANTAQSGENSYGQTVQLQPELLTAPYDISHSHPSFETEYADGAMNGWNLTGWHCKGAPKKCPAQGTAPYGYVPQYEVAPYWTLAEDYTFADNMFETDEGPSFPAHQYLISGTSTISDGSNLRASEEPLTPQGTFTGGCSSPKGSTVEVIDQYGVEDQTVSPCFDRTSLMGEAQSAGVTWHYYQSHPSSGPWNAPDAIKPIRHEGSYDKYVTHPPSKVLTDIANGNLANIVWVTPTAAASDHAGVTDGTGPSWVASVVNAVGASQYWDSSAIIVVWDDWGGWFDHVTPTVRNSFELGFRVPMIVISPYAKTGYVSHVQYEFGSILKFVEETFGLPTLGTTDEDANNLSDCFTFDSPKRKFKHIAAKYSAQYFLHLPVSTEPPDSD
jgi:phospholipase C